MDFIKGNEQVKIDPSGIDISGAGHITIDSEKISGNLTIDGDVSMNGDLSMNGDIEVHNGTVGIGTTPGSGILLDVGGHINFNGDLYKNGSLLSLDGNQATAVISKGMAVQIKHTDYTKKVVRVDTGWSGIDRREDGNGFVVKITPRSVNSKVLINAIAHIGIDPSTDSRWWGVRLYRKIGNGNWNLVSGAQGDVSVAHSIQNTDQTQATTDYEHQGQGVWFSHTVGMLKSVDFEGDNALISNSSGSYLDSPGTTEEVMYTLYWCTRIGAPNTAGPIIYLNRAHKHDDYHRPTPISSITATEIWDDTIPFTPTSLAMVIDETTDNVGIGTSNPTSRLEINTFNSADNNHLKLNRWNSDNFYSIIRHDTCPEVTTIDSLQFIVEGGNDGLPDNQDVKMVINSNGFVGIGKTNPEFPLDIAGTITGPAIINVENTYILHSGGAEQRQAHYDADTSISIRTEMSGYFRRVYVPSDSRIKTEISLVNDDTALKRVNALESKEYHYIDPERRRPMKTIGFIAQEVKEVIPNAVSLQKEWVPDEMRIITDPQWEGNNLTIPDLDMSGNFTGKAKFYVANDPSGNDEVCKEVEIKEVPDNSRPLFPTATKFVAEFDQSWNNVFFYGKQVSDFHTIDKNQIFALHHSAIQELSRRNDEKTEKISVLENKVNSITVTNALLKSTNESMKSRLDTLENIVAGLQNN